MNKYFKWILLMVLTSLVANTQAQVIYSCDFETYRNHLEWTAVETEESNQWCMGFATATTPDTRSLYISNDNGISYAYNNGNPLSCAIIYHTFYITDAGRYVISYDWKCEGNGSDDFMRAGLFDGDYPITIPSYAFNHWTPNEMTSLDRGTFLSGQVEWTTCAKEVFLDTGAYKIVFFFWADQYNNEYKPAAIDNVVIRQTHCPAITDLYTYNSFTDGFSVGWSLDTAYRNWSLEYGPVGFTCGSEQGTIVTDIDTNSYTITGLNPNSHYDVYVWANCCIDTSLKVKTSGHTSCSYTDLPYIDNFDNYSVGSIPICWTIRTGHCEIAPKYLYYDEGNVIEISHNATIVTPLFDIPEDGVAITFNSWGEGSLDVGYVTDLSTWDYQYIATASISSSMTSEYYIELNNNIAPLPDSCYIVFSQVIHKNLYGTNIDNLQILPLSTTHYATNFYAINVTTTSAQLCWSCNVDSVTFELDGGDYFDWDAGEWTHFYRTVVNDTTTTLTGFWPNNTLTFRFRSIYQGDTSCWYYGGSVTFLDKPKNVQNIRVIPRSSSIADCYWERPKETLPDQYLIKCYNTNGNQLVHSATISDNSTYYRFTGLSSSSNYKVVISTVVNNDTSSVKNYKFNTSNYDSHQLNNHANDMSWKFPFANGYGVCQSLYSGELFRELSNITHVSLNLGTSEGPERKIKVYVGFTDKSVLLRPSDAIPLSDLTLVYDGTFRIAYSGWNNLYFSTNIPVQEGKNLVITICDTTGAGTNVRNYMGFGSSLVSQSPNPYDMNNINYYAYENTVPDIHFYGASSNPTYYHPRLLSRTPTAHSITYTWQQLGSESSWTVGYRRFGDTAWTTSTASTTSQTYTINNLVPGTYYEVRIGSIVGNTTLYSYDCIYTLAGICNVPYIENLKTVKFNDAWNSKGLSFYSEGVATIYRNKYAILPKINLPINQLQIALNLRANQGDYIIGVSQSHDQISNFVPIDTVHVGTQLGLSSTRISYLNNYTGDDGYIVIRAITGDISFDSICVDSIANCIPPEDAHIAGFGKDYIHVAWKDNPNVASWQVILHSDTDSLHLNDTIIVDTNSVTFNGLMANTPYTITLNTNCGSEQSVSIPLRCITLTQNPLSLPLYCDFMDAEMNSKWQFLSDTVNHWIIGSLRPDGDSLIYITDTSNHDHRYVPVDSYALAYIPIQIDEKGLYGFQFDWECSTETFITGQVYIVPSSFDFQKLMNVGYFKAPDDWILVGDPLELHSWTTSNYVTDLDQGVYYFVLVWECNYWSDYDINDPIIIDNIRIDKIKCSNPENIQVNNITDTSAFISWDVKSHNVDGWSISFNNQEPIDIDKPYYFVNNLNPSTTYLVSVKTNCSSDNQSMFLFNNFMTDCGSINKIPHINTFQYQIEDQFPYCWYESAGDSKIHFGYLVTELAGNRQSDFTMQQISENINLDTTKVVFDASSPEEAIIEVGLVDDPYDFNSFVLIDSAIITPNEQHYQFRLYGYNNYGRYIAFRIHANHDIPIENSKLLEMDNVGLQTLDECEYPLNPYVAVSTWQQITIKWKSYSTQSEWEAVIASEDGTYLDTLIVSTPSATFDNLTRGNRYLLKVRALCNDIDYESVWSQPISASTNCGVATNLQATNITATSADISWTASPDQQRWIVLYGKKGFYASDINSAQVIETNQPQVSLQNLIPETTYDVHIKSICDETNSSISLPVTFKATDNPDVGIDGIQGNYELSIHPNPATGATTITLLGIDGEVTIALIDINGRHITTETLNCNAHCEKRLELTNLPRGTYFIRLLGNNINSVRKLIIR